MKFPAICPDIPVADLTAALAYYRDSLGFNVDWSADGLGLACVSRGDTRLFMSNAGFRTPLGVRGPILLWLNLDGREEIDELHREWHAAGAKLSGPPTSHPDAKLSSRTSTATTSASSMIMRGRSGRASRAARAGRTALDFCAPLREWAAFRSPVAPLSFRVTARR